MGQPRKKKSIHLKKKRQCSEKIIAMQLHCAERYNNRSVVARFVSSRRDSLPLTCWCWLRRWISVATATSLFYRGCWTSLFNRLVATVDLAATTTGGQKYWIEINFQTNIRIIWPYFSIKPVHRFLLFMQNQST